MLLLLGLILCSAAAVAQEGSPPERRGTKLEEKNTIAGICVNAGRAKNLRGIELKNYAKICMAEAQLACLKKAVAENQNGGRQRKQFMDNCLATATPSP
jgi:hypothetical protein